MIKFIDNLVVDMPFHWTMVPWSHFERNDFHFPAGFFDKIPLKHGKVESSKLWLERVSNQDKL